MCRGVAGKVQYLQSKRKNDENARQIMMIQQEANCNKSAIKVQYDCTIFCHISSFFALLKTITCKILHFLLQNIALFCHI
nr:MAG TPA: hypothetical protein [Caudoviricetes sp.]